jgi:hypothetical protein
MAQKFVVRASFLNGLISEIITFSKVHNYAVVQTRIG